MERKLSPQSVAKIAQGYMDKLQPQACMHCAHYTSEIVMRKGVFGGPYEVESNKRCGLGGFAVKKLGTCKEWKGKV